MLSVYTISKHLAPPLILLTGMHQCTILYTPLGFEPNTFWLGVFYPNLLTRSGAFFFVYLSVSIRTMQWAEPIGNWAFKVKTSSEIALESGKRNFSTKTSRTGTLERFVYNSLSKDQCDQMARLLFIISPFSTLRICPIAFKIHQSKLKTLANTIWTLTRWPTFACGGKVAKFRLIWSRWQGPKEI